MCTDQLNVSIMALLLTLLSSPAATQSSAFTYQGQLRDAGQPVTDTVDLEFRLFDQLSGGSQIGSAQSQLNWPVEDGLFQVELDFGGSAFTGAERYLDVRVNGTPLIPRQRVTAAPYALLAAATTDGAVGGSAVDPTQVQLRVSGSCSAGQAIRTINQNGTVICEVDDIGSVGWSLSGNAGTDPSADFLGTTDAAPFEIRTANARSLRIEPSAELFGGQPITANFIAGSRANEALSGVRGATIGGGGVPLGSNDPDVDFEEPNRVSDHYGTVGGGLANVAGNFAGSLSDATFSTVSGGVLNAATGERSTIGGGFRNSATGSESTVGGGSFNRAEGDLSTVSGGNVNTASGIASTVAGGDQNIASGIGSSVAGGRANTAAGENSFVSGFRARNSNAAHDGVFMFSDNQNADFISTGANQFLVRADGGFGFNTNAIPSGIEAVFRSRPGSTPNVDLYLRTADHGRGINLGMIPGTGAAEFRVAQFDGTSFTDRLFLRANGDFQVTAQAFKPGGGSWAASSDRRLKNDVKPLSSALDRMLALQGVTFEYTDPDPARRPAGQHIGFIAQEVAEVFPDWVETDRDGYLTVGSRGFEALTVEAMRDLRDEKDAAIAQLAEENAELRAQLAEVQTRQRDELTELRAELAMLRDLVAPRVAQDSIE